MCCYSLDADKLLIIQFCGKISLYFAGLAIAENQRMARYILIHNPTTHEISRTTFQLSRIMVMLSFFTLYFNTALTEKKDSTQMYFEKTTSVIYSSKQF